ncbi:unnamed protein product [Durusdinium trenchii]|uniref:Uncharacterized protein n=1 Tax=Durusdinium trenchii TaxID=1381693 RepID=A0ABP0PPU6_9DINO
MLWLEFRESNPGISYLTFWRRYKNTWKTVLKFLAPTTHSTCDTCLDFKTRFKRAFDSQSKYNVAREYKQHLDEIRADRLDGHLPVTFRGGLKDDETGHHAFLFMLRRDVPRNLIIKVDDQTGLDLEAHELDVIIMVKRRASDDCLAQEALLAMPYQFMVPILNQASKCSGGTGRAPCSEEMLPMSLLGARLMLNRNARQASMGRLELKAAVRAVAAATDGRTTQLSFGIASARSLGFPAGQWFRASPICISFSKAGKRQGTSAPSYQCHKAFYEKIAGTHDALLIENVPEYPQRYAICWRSSKISWRPDVDLDAVIESAKVLDDYRKLLKVKCPDLQQYPANGRGRGELRDGTLQTLTTNSDKERFLTGDEVEGCDEVISIPLMAFRYQLPVDGLPILHSWLRVLKDVLLCGFESWRETLEVKSMVAMPYGQPMDFGQVGVHAEVWELLEMHLHAFKFEQDYMSDAETALEVLDPQFNPEETTMFKEHKPEEVDAVKEQVAQCDAQVSVLNQDARKAQFEADCLALARDLAQVASLYKVIEKGERGRRSDKDREQNTFNGCQIMLDRILLNSVLMKSGVSSGGTVGIMNLTPYDAWLERTCHKGFDGMTFRTVSTTKNLQISQYVEKVLALDLMEDWQLNTEWKAGKSPRFANVRPYEKDPPPPPPGQGEVDPSAYPLKVVKLDFDVDPSKKGWDRLKLSIPPCIRSRHIEDPVYGPEWTNLLADFDSQYGRKNAAEIQALVVAAQEEQKAPPVKIVPWEEPVALEQVMDQYVVETKFSGRMAGTSLLLVRARRRDGSLSQVVDDQEFKLFIVVWRHFMGRMTDQR